MLGAAEILKIVEILAWPTLAAIAFFRLFPVLQSKFSSGNVRIKFGGMELTAEQATESISNQIKDLQEKVLSIEGALKEAPSLKAGVIARSQNQRPRILWVDDVPSNNALQIDKLMADGFVIDLANSTSRAIEMFENGDYDLVITDMGRKEDGTHRPEAGIQLAREIRRRNPKIPIVVFTTHQAVARFAEATKAAGVNLITNSTIELYKQIDLLGRTTLST